MSIWAYFSAFNYQVNKSTLTYMKAEYGDSGASQRQQHGFRLK